MRYDFLQVSDEMLDVRSVALANLLTSEGWAVSAGDALRLILLLERYVVQRANADAKDVLAEFRAASILPKARAHTMLALATATHLDRAGVLLKALADPDVKVLEVIKGGWALRGVAERYGRFARLKKAARDRTRNNERARAAGWATSGDGKTWVHPSAPDEHMTLDAVIALLDARESET